MTGKFFHVSTVVTLLFLWIPTTVVCDTPTKLNRFDDVIKALRMGAPVRFQVNNATACLSTSTAIAKNMAYDINVAMVTSVSGQAAVLTWNKRIIEGAILNSTGPVTLLVETGIYANGTVTFKVTGYKVKDISKVFSGQLTCRWTGGSGGGGSNNASAASIYQQDKYGIALKDFPTLQQTLHTGYSMAYDLDLSKMEPPGQGLVIGRMQYYSDVSVNEREIQFDQTWCNGTHRTSLHIQTAAQTVKVIQQTYDVTNYQILSSVIRTGPFAPGGSMRYIKLPYDS